MSRSKSSSPPSRPWPAKPRSSPRSPVWRRIPLRTCWPKCPNWVPFLTRPQSVWPGWPPSHANPAPGRAAASSRAGGIPSAGSYTCPPWPRSAANPGMKHTYRALARTRKTWQGRGRGHHAKLLVLANVLIQQDRLWTPQRPQARTKLPIGESSLPMPSGNILRRNPTGETPKRQTTHPFQLAPPYLWLPMLDNMATPSVEGWKPSFPRGLEALVPSVEGWKPSFPAWGCS